ncbi:MAG: DUF4465 domain-containing protein [Muribaculaceae bacterium]|nr:DUF4465 domain-containing protein [Muribaculaceae bacterium]
MKNYFKFFLPCMLLTMAFGLSGCSDDDDNPIDNFPEWHDVTVEFKDVPDNLIASNAYGSNLYYGAQDQITTGYIPKLDWGKYIQFPINYGSTFDADFNSVWGYSYYNGGLAVSKYHDMETASYENQLSVYDTTSPSGGNFLVAYGASMATDPDKAKYSDYNECAHIYITDSKGFTVSDPGTAGSFVSGEEFEAYFKSVWINNTTYTYLTMLNGNPYSSALNEENKGWFKVQFIAFDDDDPDSKPLGYVEAYLANFDEKLADGYTGIIEEWIEVDLSPLPYASILVINFAGSDTGEYGLNTPKYCALDKFELQVCP